MIKISFLLISLIIFTSTFSQDEEDVTLKTFVPFKKNELFGFKKNDQIVLPAKYLYVTHFFENSALVQSSETKNGVTLIL